MKEKEKWYDEIESNVCVGVIIFMMCVLTWQVFSRFGFRISYAWIDELSRYGLVWFAYIAACYAIIHNQHIKIDLFLHLWPRKMRRPVRHLSNVIFLLYAAAVSYYSMQWVSGLRKMGTLSLGTHFPIWIFSMIIPAAHILMAVRLLQVEIRYLKNPERMEAERAEEESGLEVTEG